MRERLKALLDEIEAAQISIRPQIEAARASWLKAEKDLQALLERQARLSAGAAGVERALENLEETA